MCRNDIYLNFLFIAFLGPFLICHLSSIRLLDNFADQSIERYMETIKFPNGLDPLDFDHISLDFLDQYRSKTIVLH